MAIRRLSANAISEMVLEQTDIGGTNAQSIYVDMKGVDSVHFDITLGTTSGTSTGWDAADTLDTCRLYQATSALGAGAKNLGTALTANDPSAAGEKYVLEAKAEDLDVENGFRYIACYVAESGNTEVDNVTIHACRHNLTDCHENVDGAEVVQYV